MKKTCSLFIAVVFTVSAFGQELYKITQVENALPLGFEREVFVLSLVHTETTDFENLALNYFKKQTKKNAENVNDLYVFSDVLYKAIGNETLSIALRVVPKEESAGLYVSFEINNQAISNLSKPIEYEKVKSELKNVSRLVLADAFKKKLDRQNTDLKTLEKDRKSAHKSADKYRKKITKIRVEIDKRNKEISLNEGQQMHKTDEIGQKRNQVNQMEGEMKKAAKSELKSLEKESKGMYKDKEGLHKDVLKLEADKRELEYQLGIEEAKAKSIEEQIAQQRVKISSTKSGMKEIKRIK